MPDLVSCEACFAAISRSATGGGLISRGHLYKILSNPIYIGPSPIRARSTKAFNGGRFGHPSVQYDAQHFTFPLAPGSDLSRAKTTQ